MKDVTLTGQVTPNVNVVAASAPANYRFSINGPTPKPPVLVPYTPTVVPSATFTALSGGHYTSVLELLNGDGTVVQLADANGNPTGTAQVAGAFDVPVTALTVTAPQGMIVSMS